MSAGDALRHVVISSALKFFNEGTKLAMVGAFPFGSMMIREHAARIGAPDE